MNADAGYTGEVLRPFIFTPADAVRLYQALTRQPPKTRTQDPQGATVETGHEATDAGPSIITLAIGAVVVGYFLLRKRKR